MRRVGVILSLAVGVSLAALAAAVIAYKLAYPSFTHRLRLTIDVNVAGQVRSSSGVIEVTWQTQPGIGNSPWYCSIKGDAVLIDVGSGHHVMAILRQFRDLDRSGREGKVDLCATALLSYGLGVQHSVDELNALSRKSGRVAVHPRAVPTFVTFTDENNPQSAVVIRPEDFPLLLRGVRLAGVWVELTDLPVTRDIVSTVPAVAALMKDYAGKRDRLGVFRAWGTDFSQPLQSQAITRQSPVRRTPG